jgi:hypothetical protein
MNDLMGECPSLLDDLVFYPMWQGSQCVDMISGAILTKSGVLPTDAFGGDVAGRYSSAYLNGPAIRIGDSDFSIAAWTKIADYVTAPVRRVIIGSWKFLGADSRSFMISYRIDLARYLFAVSPDGINESSYSANSFGASQDQNWHLVGGWHDASQNTVGVSVDLKSDIYSHSTGVYPSIAATRIGNYDGTVNAYLTGSVGQSPMWRRILSDSEWAHFYNNGLGLRYPFRR